MKHIEAFTPAILFYLRHYWFGLTLALIIIVLGLIDTSNQNILRFDRPAILSYQLWRIITAHLVHLGWSHLLMNLAGLVMVFFFFGTFLKNSQWFFIFFISALGTSLLLLQLNPQLVWYVGLSGVLHGFFIAGGIADIKVNPKEAYVFLALIIGKLIWEQIYGPLPGSEATAGGHVLVDAHLFGAIWGALAMIIISLTTKLFIRRQ